MINNFYTFLIVSLLLLPPSTATQNYSGSSALDCHASSALLYTCNPLVSSSCHSFLIFRSSLLHSSVADISALTSSDAAKLAHLNAVPNPLSEFVAGQDVIVPVTCSCRNSYYRANTSFTLTASQGTYYIVSSEIFGGLATCAAIKRENPWPDVGLKPGMEIQIPLRCACPTIDQASAGVNYLLTYPISSDDNLPEVAKRFNSTEKRIMEANNLIVNETGVVNLIPGTTILIPLLGFPSSSMTKIHSRVPGIGSPPAAGGSKRSKVKILELTGLAAACFLLVMSLISGMVFLARKRRRKVKKNDVAGEIKRDKVKEDFRVEIASCERALTVFGIDEVKKGTENFSLRNRIKGSVYSGVFAGKVLAVKKMSREIDISQEVNILMRINHFNVIKLHGVCEDLESFYLVSEYMEFGCLKEWLRRNKRKKEQEKWETRVKIGLDIANGLHYLHNFTEPAYVHQDIKSSNVLLNSELRAKITNFSLAKSAAARDKANTVHLIGTRGYMAPEYVETGEVTPKVDVYAFGVVLLELITGKEAVLGLGNGKETLLSTTMVSLIESELGSHFDPGLGEGGMEMGVALYRVSLACLRREAECRPSMEEVVSNLVKILTDFNRSKPLTDESITDQSVPLRRYGNDWTVETASW
ncbi:LysM domain receptor-like kinase 4 [Linum grandiflorum]